MEDFHKTRRLPPYVFEQVNRLKASARSRGADIIDLGMGNPDLPTPKAIVDKLIETARRGDTHGYSQSKGIPRLRKAICDWYQRRFDVTLDPASEAIVTLGSKEGLAHLALALIGEGEATEPTTAAPENRHALTGIEVLRAAGVEPLALQAKEGLALLNGTQLSLSLALDGLFRAESLLDASVVCCAMTVEGLAGSHAPFDDRIQQASRLPGQIDAARRIRSLLDSDSEIRRSHENCERVQDPYAVRCMPQVFGAVEHTLRHARDVLGAAINGVSDNPLIFGADVLSGGGHSWYRRIGDVRWLHQAWSA